MDRIQVTGEIPLGGEVTVQGSKNAALPVMAAALLHEGRTVLHNCPEISDVACMGQILRELGCRVTQEGHTLTIDAAEVRAVKISEAYATRLRASVVLLGSLLGRLHAADLPYPGGCTIGSRPVDLHLQALEMMGAAAQEQGTRLRLRTEGLHGEEISFAFPSVGATENAIMAAVRASGETVLRHAAREPEVMELCRFLQAAGADICVREGEIRIRGVKALRDSEFTLMPDRIVAGTYLLAAAATRGSVRLKGAQPAHLQEVLSKLRAMGAVVREEEDAVWLDGTYAGRPLSFTRTAPYPGFPTDLQSPLLAALCMARGKSRIRETLFEERFLTVPQLRAMGARIETAGSEACVWGGGVLHGAQVSACELRGGAALVIAGLAAKGSTQIVNCRYIERGYEDICRDLRALGAKVEKFV